MFINYLDFIIKAKCVQNVFNLLEKNEIRKESIKSIIFILKKAVRFEKKSLSCYLSIRNSNTTYVHLWVW